MYEEKTGPLGSLRVKTNFLQDKNYQFLIHVQLRSLDPNYAQINNETAKIDLSINCDPEETLKEFWKPSLSPHQRLVVVNQSLTLVFSVPSEPTII